MKDKRMHAKFWYKNLKSGDLLEDAVIHTRLILKWIFQKYDGRMWTEFILLRIEYQWWALVSALMNLKLYKMQGSSWVAEWVFSSGTLLRGISSELLVSCLLACLLTWLFGWLFLKYFFCLLICNHISSKYIPFIYVNLEDLNNEIFNIGFSTKWRAKEPCVQNIPTVCHCSGRRECLVWVWNWESATKRWVLITMFITTNTRLKRGHGIQAFRFAKLWIPQTSRPTPHQGKSVLVQNIPQE